MNKSGPEQNPWKYAGLAGAVGMDLVVFILLGYYGGAAVSDRTGQRIWTAVGLMVGLLVALVTIVFMIKRILEETNE